MGNVIKKIVPYVAYYALASFVGIAFLSQIWIGVIILDDPEMITSGDLIGMGITSAIILGVMLFLATRKTGHAVGLTVLSLCLSFAITIPFLFNFPIMNGWQKINTMEVLLAVTCLLAIIINGTKAVRKMVLKKNYA